MKRKVEVENRRIGGTGLVVGRGEGQGQGVGQGQGEGLGQGVGEGVGLGVGRGEGQGEGEGRGVGLVVGAGVPCPVQAHSCACPTKQASPSSTPPQFAAAPQSAALWGSGRSPVSLASKGGAA